MNKKMKKLKKRVLELEKSLAEVPRRTKVIANPGQRDRVQRYGH